MAVINKAELGVGVEIRGKLNVGSIHGERQYGGFEYGAGSELAGIYQIRSRDGKQVQVKMAFYVPTNPQTQAQQAWRLIFSNGVSAWQALSEAVKDDWREQAEDRPMTGFNLFLRTYLLSQ